jgi:hypothetical protein
MNAARMNSRRHEKTISASLGYWLLRASTSATN